jgi:hypothetical protein
MIKKNTNNIKHLEIGGYYHYLFTYLINGKLDELKNIRDTIVKKSIFFPISFYNYKGQLNTFEGIIFIRNLQNVLLSKIKAIIGGKVYIIGFIFLEDLSLEVILIMYPQLQFFCIARWLNALF